MSGSLYLSVSALQLFKHFQHRRATITSIHCDPSCGVYASRNVMFGPNSRLCEALVSDFAVIRMFFGCEPHFDILDAV